jgi:tellurite methyltransferase
VTDWDARYREGRHDSAEPHPLIVTTASKMRPGRALDVACGTGRHALWLAAHGWDVTAVDSSSVALDILNSRAGANPVKTVLADLERHEFALEPQSFDLIVVCNYLQRDLFPALRDGTTPGGVIIAVIAMADDDPGVRPMNPAFLLGPGELRTEFQGWELLHDFEGKPGGDSSRRNVAEIVTRRPQPSS